jgi:hypothetical protein
MSLKSKYASVLPRRIEVPKEHFNDDEWLISEVRNSIKLYEEYSDVQLEYDVEIEVIE